MSRRPTQAAAQRPQKRFGQHFLEPAWVDKLVARDRAGADETFLEIGPGRGALTRPLAARAAARRGVRDRSRSGGRSARRPQSAEPDRRRGRFPRRSSRDPDVLRHVACRVATHATDPSALRVAGNLPYNVASPILFKLVDLYAAGLPLARRDGDAAARSGRSPARAARARKDYGVLTVLIGHWAHVERLLSLAAGRVPAGAEGALRGRPAGFTAEPPAATSAIFRAPGPGRLHAAAEDARQRAPGLSAVAGWLQPADALQRAGIDGTPPARNADIAEFVRLADVCCRRQEIRV